MSPFLVVLATRSFVVSAVVLLLAACGTAQTHRAEMESITYRQALPPEEFARLSPPEQIRYFTDQAYLGASQPRAEQSVARLAAASAALAQLIATPDERTLVEFWTGVDAEFFGRVNQAFPSEDYSRPQVPTPTGTRDAYVLAPGYLNLVPNVNDGRRAAMTALIHLASDGDASSCLAFQKAYRSYRDPVGGATGVTWLAVDAKPVQRSVWGGSAEAFYQGRVVQVPVPRTVVLGCRRISHIPAKMNPGVAEDAERYFAKVNVLMPDFDAAAYQARKETWRKRIVEQAQGAATKIRAAGIKFTGVNEVYQIFPPENDYRYERAMRDGSFMDMVGSGVLQEEIAFEVEQRIHERELLIGGTPVSPEETPLTLIYLVAKRLGVESR